MSDCSPIMRRRPRPPLSSATPASSSSRQNKRKKKSKKIKKLRHERKNHRQARLSCKLLDHQAKEKSDDECSNSEDDADASDDSIVASNSDDPDGNFSLYALSMTSQAEAAGFTVPLNQVRHQDRSKIADQVLQSLACNKSKGFKDYLARVRDGVGQEVAHIPQLTEPHPPITAPPPCCYNRNQSIITQPTPSHNPSIEFIPSIYRDNP